MPKQNDEDTILLRLANLAKKHTVFDTPNATLAHRKALALRQSAGAADAAGRRRCS